MKRWLAYLRHKYFCGKGWCWGHTYYVYGVPTMVYFEGSPSDDA